MNRILFEKPFEYLSKLEGKEIKSIKDIKNANKHLWVDIVINEKSFKSFLNEFNHVDNSSKQYYEEHLKRAATWFYHYEPTLKRLGIFNEELESYLNKIEFLSFERHEWKTYRRMFDKGIFYGR